MIADVPTILYVEDDANLAFITKHNLTQSGYQVIHCTEGNEAWQVFSTQKISLCILDVMLPGMSGFELAVKIRESNKDVPVLFLTAKSLLEDKITGLQIGADDYLTKPFSYLELELKVKVFLKRSVVAKEESNLLKIGSLTFDFENLLLSNKELKHRLTLKEAELMKYLLANKNKVLKRDEILTAVWGDDDYFVGRSLDVFISRLRKYLATEENVSIDNLHGVGFKMVVR